MDIKPKKESWIEQCIRNRRFFQAGTEPTQWKLGDCFLGFECEVPDDTIPDGTEWIPCEQQGHYKLVAKEKDTSDAAEHSDTAGQAQ